MIKIRLHGVEQEIFEYLKKLQNDENIYILSNEIYTLIVVKVNTNACIWT